MTVGQRVKQLRLFLDFSTPEAFARFLGINASRIRGAERGGKLTITLALHIKHSIPGCSLDWLYYGEPKLRGSLKPLNH